MGNIKNNWKKFICIVLVLVCIWLPMCSFTFSQTAIIDYFTFAFNNNFTISQPIDVYGRFVANGIQFDHIYSTQGLYGYYTLSFGRTVGTDVIVWAAGTPGLNQKGTWESGYNKITILPWVLEVGEDSNYSNFINFLNSNAFVVGRNRDGYSQNGYYAFNSTLRVPIGLFTNAREYQMYMWGYDSSLKDFCCMNIGGNRVDIQEIVLYGDGANFALYFKDKNERNVVIYRKTATTGQWYGSDYYYKGSSSLVDSSPISAPVMFIGYDVDGPYFVERENIYKFLQYNADFSATGHFNNGATIEDYINNGGNSNIDLPSETDSVQSWLDVLIGSLNKPIQYIKGVFGSVFQYLVSFNSLLTSFVNWLPNEVIACISGLLIFGIVIVFFKWLRG